MTDLHPALLPLSFLLGTWAGEGVGGYPTLEEDFAYRQEVTFSHYGKPVLAYTSRSWLVETGAPAAAESGYWRPVPGDLGALEVVLAHPTGFAEVYYGTVTGTRVELATEVVARTATAKDVTAEHRLYGLVEGELMYAVDMAAVGQPLQPHLSARLRRTG